MSLSIDTYGTAFFNTKDEVVGRHVKEATFLLIATNIKASLKKRYKQVSRFHYEVRKGC